MCDQPSSKKIKFDSFIGRIEDNRKNTAESIMECRFNEKRIRFLRTVNETQTNCKGILYWMFRDVRVHDNWAFLFAQKVAIKHQLPLHVCFCILPKFLDASIRCYKFLVQGLLQIDVECKKLNITFHLLHGEPNRVIADFLQKYRMGAMITDFFPLRLPLYWLNDLNKQIPKDIPIYQVDAHNIVPCWVASEKLEYSARTIRSKINTKLDEFLTEFPPVVIHPYRTTQHFQKNDWDKALNDIQVDRSVSEITWAQPGYENGTLVLNSFLQNRLKTYHTKRNDPLADGNSDLSPWFHFGMISVQRCILEVLPYKDKYKKSVEAFMEEAIIRRELCDNFCYYNENYDTLKGANIWAINTLNLHRDDKRPYVYDLHELENSLTHDDLWNACQNQLMKRGKMHGYLRMYWAKKMLEWTPTPDDALKWAIYLNDKYSIDGCDPNGYVGCMWSICGIHDQGFKERPVFGKIRYMNYKGCERKFDVKEFVTKWNGKACFRNDIILK